MGGGFIQAVGLVIGAVLCAGTCDVTCSPDEVVEAEPCGEDTNGGCNSTPPAYSVAACGQVICGTAWSTTTTRDTDWYLIDHAGGVLTVEVLAEFDATWVIVDGIDRCAPFVVGSPGCGVACEAGILASADLAPGRYAVFVAPALPNCGDGLFPALDCGQDNAYRLIVTGAGPCCRGDVDGDGSVGTTDLLALLAAWGPGPGDPADLDGDGAVGVTDFLTLLAAWGPC